jgi:tRNA (guanine37-N1)-methyltransferase
MAMEACRHSILGRAESGGKVRFSAVNPRDFASDKHRTVDDTPYGGGPGMLMKPDVVASAIESLPTRENERRAVVFCEPTGRLFTQADAAELASYERLIFVCGHYEGIDDRVRQLFATHTFSIGDFVLTGGELPALVMADAVVRLLPGVLGSEASLAIDSHADGLLSAPQFTRPEVFRDLRVPEELVGGDHGRAGKWKRAQSLLATRRSRPDLFCRAKLEKGDADMLSSWARNRNSARAVVPNVAARARPCPNLRSSKASFKIR